MLKYTYHTGRSRIMAVLQANQYILDSERSERCNFFTIITHIFLVQLTLFCIKKLLRYLRTANVPDKKLDMHVALFEEYFKKINRKHLKIVTLKSFKTKK